MQYNVHMPKLIPLQQWICDTCGEVIEQPEDGWLEFEFDREKHRYTGFHIVHHLSKSPRKQYAKEGCYVGTNRDNHLQYFVGPDGFAHLTSYLHSGFNYSEPFTKLALDEESLGEFTDVLRRLHLPYYEEARQYFERGRSEGLFVGANETLPFTKNSMLELIDRYTE